MQQFYAANFLVSAKGQCLICSVDQNVIALAVVNRFDDFLSLPHFEIS